MTSKREPVSERVENSHPGRYFLCRRVLEGYKSRYIEELLDSVDLFATPSVRFAVRDQADEVQSDD